VSQRLLRWLLALDRRPGLSILIFHRVHTEPDPFRPENPDSGDFAAFAALLANSFTVLPLDDAIQRLASNSLPRAAVSITFDDGYRDNLEIAAPILSAHGLVATIFITTGFLDGGWMWNDRIIEACKRTARTSLVLPERGFATLDLSTQTARIAAARELIKRTKYLSLDERLRWASEVEQRLDVRLGAGPMLRPEDLKRLRAAGMGIGAHTVDHPILAKIDDTAARAQIVDSRTRLVEILHEPVSLFAFPNGQPGRDYRPEHVEMVVQAGYAGAFSTVLDTARPGMSRYELPRFTPWDKVPWKFGARLALRRLLDGRR
jgi:peptidoglycan/xylan/chitin deacetylase (PgdA/CDA1 family)